MATVTGFTAARMQEIEDSAIVGGEVVGGNLILTKHDDTTIDAGPVIGPTGDTGPTGLMGIPGEVKLWPGDTLPDEGDYGKWTWANGDAFLIVDYPIAASHISDSWNTAMGLATPGVGMFRVPDLRGLTPAGLDAMPIGSARINRTTRSIAIVLAGHTGEEEHVITLPEMPSHEHQGDDHRHLGVDHTHQFEENFMSLQQGGGTAYDVQKKSMASGTIQERSTKAGPTETSVWYTKYLSESGGFGVTGLNGGSQEHENMQPTIFVPYIVKLDD